MMLLLVMICVTLEVKVLISLAEGESAMACLIYNMRL